MNETGWQGPARRWLTAGAIRTAARGRGSPRSLLALGLSLPCLEFNRFFLLSERTSLLGVVVALLQEQEYFLGIVLGAFSVVFPSLKLIVLARLAVGRATGWNGRHRREVGARRVRALVDARTWC